MEPTNTEEQDNEMYVLFADIMGTKERVLRTRHAVLRNNLMSLIDKLEKWFRPFTGKANTFNMTIFSDSILIVDGDLSIGGFNRISKAAAGLMQVSLNSSFPINGAIAKGPFTYNEDKQLFFGRALVDAYLLQKQVGYYGIIAHHSMDTDIEKYSNGNDEIKSNPYVLSDIPMKDGCISHYHLAYNLISTKRQTFGDVEKTNERMISHLENIRKTVSGKPRSYVDNTLKVLADNLSMYNNRKDDKDNLRLPLVKKIGTSDTLRDEL